MKVVPSAMKPGHLQGCISGEEVLGQVRGEVLDTLLCQHPHVDLKAEQGKDGQREYGQNDHITEVFHRFDDGTDDCFETCNNKKGILLSAAVYNAHFT